MSKTGFVKEIKRSYPVFDAVDDDGRIFPREPAKECWNSHCSSFGEKKRLFLTNLTNKFKILTNYRNNFALQTCFVCEFLFSKQTATRNTVSEMFT